MAGGGAGEDLDLGFWDAVVGGEEFDEGGVGLVVGGFGSEVGSEGAVGIGEDLVAFFGVGLYGNGDFWHVGDILA